MAKKSKATEAVVVKEPTENLWSKGVQYLKEANEFVITTEEEQLKAVETLGQIKDARKRAEAEKLKILAPAKQIIAAEKERWAPLEDMLDQVDKILRDKMLKYITAKEEKAKEDLKKLDSKIESGAISRPETIARKQDEIYASVPAKTVRSSSGVGSSTRQIKKLSIDNPELIPDEYWVIDEVKLKADVFADVKVPGASYKYENSLAIF
jgi:hypothetical protein